MAKFITEKEQHQIADLCIEGNFSLDKLLDAFGIRHLLELPRAKVKAAKALVGGADDD